MTTATVTETSITATATATAPNPAPGAYYNPPTPAAIDAVRIRGFRSLADVELTDLPRATLLLGANGAGKSNIIRFFELVSAMLGDGRLGDLVERNGGADDQLCGGCRVTPRLEAEISLRIDVGRTDRGHIDWGFADYRFALDYAHPDRFRFAEEAFRRRDADLPSAAPWQYLGSGHREARLPDIACNPEYPGVQRDTARAIVRRLSRCAVYQFDDTAHYSNLKKGWDVADNARLRGDAGNLAAVLYRVQQENKRLYQYICFQIGCVLPDFDRFDLAERAGKVMLRWRPKWGDQTIGAHLTSDGSLRFFALATLLSLPLEMLDEVILLDGPEVGLHPSGVDLLGGLINSLSADRQLIVATQSPDLVNTFEPDRLFTLDLEKGRTCIARIDLEQYRRMRESDFTLGELWQCGWFGGGP